ncbi:GGDEF domain-containing protein [Sulfurimonas microaerophilic]|uniref:GGDEF domain-containing protein n=1 Tax=Sulfurimonas microaerophilic TaxID=3058392 RepID=UPI0027155FC6|nr:sensor domain-containing diguanylate cyclase [Sulfurimonas sp. hsl 1-7]
MKQIVSNLKRNIFITVVTTIALPIVVGYLLNRYFPINFVNIPLHSALEVAGGTIAIIISLIIFLKYESKHVFNHYNYTTIALLSMGIIDIFHGIMMPGKLFVWLHSSAVFFGGMFFMLVWMKQKKTSKQTYKLVPVSVIVFAILFSLFSIIYSEYVPDMIDPDKSFSSVSNFLNIAGGLGFFVASIKFLKEYLYTQKFDEILFAGHCMLFGIAGVLFTSSLLWDMQWWLWHILRFSAYIIALYFLYLEFNKDIQLIENKNRELELADKKIGQYLSILDKNVITSTTDLKGDIIDVSEAFCKISGYTKQELIGHSHNIVRHPDMPSSIYKEVWNTLHQGKTWRGEIKNRKKDGSAYWVDTNITPVYDEHGKKVGYTAVRQDITNKKRIEEISIRDGLTNIFNRRYFNELFPKYINMAKRKNELISFLILDIDHFKEYNDTYGHQKGDEVLITVAQTLKKSLKRADDFCFRLGGEEFGILFSVETKEKAALFSDEIRENIENLKIEHEHNSASQYITISLGVVSRYAKDISQPEKIYAEADKLLYKAKKSGRNKVSSE